ncbi:MAG: histidine kinase, partial [Anaerolineaceae bacterium]|nr:histidine kinase [Anaerolineaceae bacterium]
EVIVGGGRAPIKLDIPFLIVFVDTFVLLGYLLLPGLPSRVGRIYLPIALLVVSVGPVLESFWVRDLIILGPLAALFQPFIYLFVPLVLIAWQYDFRQVVMFSIGTTLLDTVLILTMQEIELLTVARAGLVFVRTVTFLFVGYRVTRLMKVQRAQRQQLAETNREISRANIKLVQYAATIEQFSISRERNRLARELHDTLAHTLSGLAVQLDAITAIWESIPPRAAGMLERALEITRSGLDETRRTLQDLRAAPLEEMGLALALRLLAEETTSRFQVYRSSWISPSRSVTLRRMLNNVFTAWRRRHWRISTGMLPQPGCR